MHEQNANSFSHFKALLHVNFGSIEKRLHFCCALVTFFIIT